MNTLHDLPNISKVIEEKLIEAGINSPEMFKKLGSRDAFIRIKLNDSTACINMLYALEGTVQGIRWHYLPDEVKKDLKEFYKSL